MFTCLPGNNINYGNTMSCNTFYYGAVLSLYSSNVFERIFATSKVLLASSSLVIRVSVCKINNHEINECSRK